MKEYLGKEGFRQLVKLVRDALAKKADKAELAVQSNPNLLDNWYFVNPVNQRVQTEYTEGYTIDRWKIVGDNASKSVSVETTGLHVTKCAIRQDLLENAYNDDTVPDKQWMTLSILFSDGSLHTKSKNIEKGKFTEGNIDSSVGAQFGYPSGTNRLFVLIDSLAQNNENGIIIAAVKLEFSDHQTLAHQDAEGNWVLNDPPPDYGMELAKCQRYQRKVGNGLIAIAQGEYLSFTFPFESEMAKNPVASLLRTTVNLMQGSSSVQLTEVIIVSQQILKDGAIFILLSGVYSAKLTDGSVCRINENNPLFFIDGNL